MTSIRALQVLEADRGFVAPSGDELADHAGPRRVVALVVVAACARNPSVRGVGLAPGYRRWAVRVGELPATRWARHEAFARAELCEQIARLFKDAKTRESAELVPALAAAQGTGSVHMISLRERERERERDAFKHTYTK